MNLLSGLSEEEMEHAMQLVIYRHPASLPASTEVYDLEIGSLDALTLRQLLAFSNLCKKRKREGQDALWPGLPGGAGLHWPHSLALSARAIDYGNVY